MLSQALWLEASPILRAIDAHPFVSELASGALKRERFAEYMIQDAIYLRGFARVLAYGSVKAPDADAILEFAKAAEVAIVVERALHAGFLERFGIDAATAEAAEASPTGAAYVNHLLATATTGGFGEIVAAVLPCFWIYQDVGSRIKAGAAPDNPYQAWIDTYAGESSRRRAPHDHRLRHGCGERWSRSARCDARGLPALMPLRVDVLGRRLAAGGLAGLNLPRREAWPRPRRCHASFPSRTPTIPASRVIAPSASVTWLVATACSSPKGKWC
jgi:thiaminase/transcriptional activator TenA